jgi:competence protein ComEC
MVRWIPYTMVRVAIVFMAGILLAIYHPDIPYAYGFYSLWISAVLYALVYWLAFRKSVLKIGSGLMGLIFVLSAGFVVLHIRTERRQNDHFLHMKDSIQSYVGEIVKSPEEKKNSWKLEVKLTRVKTKQGWQSVSGRSLVYLSKKDLNKLPAFGEQWLIRGAPQLLTPPANPYEFDFKRFLSFRNIYHQHFIRLSDLSVIGQNTHQGILYYSMATRAWAIHQLHKYMHGEQEFAIAKALVLGVTDGLDNELENAYSASGAMHVLAVSGLHVSIIYGLLLFLLKPLQKHASSRWVIAILSLICLWIYAFVTGLSPSVLRAVTMFSFMVIARPMGWTTNIFNTLAASAFILLLYNPYLIMSVGFQLSYLAVMGIISLQRPLYNLWTAPQVFLDKIWQITTVSIAAQIATFALGLLYFHQFPVYFLFSNLFVIPGSFVILLGGILVLFTSFIPPVAEGVGLVTEYAIRVINWGVFAVEKLPLSLINHVHINTLQCWLLIGMILGLMYLFLNKRFSGLLFSISCVFVFVLIQWHHFTEHVQQKQWIVYRIPGHTVMEFIDHGKSNFYTDSLLARDHERIRFHIRPNRIMAGVSYVNEQISVPDKEYELKVWNGLRILTLHSTIQKLPAMPVDYVVVTHASERNLALVQEKFQPRMIILDSSHPVYREKKLLKQAKEHNIHVHSVLSEGAFTQSLSF